MIDNKSYILLSNHRLETERLILRPLSIHDAQDLFEMNADENTTQFLFEPHTKLEQTEKMLAKYYLKEPIGKFGVELKETKKMIGTIEFRIKDFINSGELGYSMNSAYWGKGYMSEGCHAILELAFTKLDLASVYAQCDLENTASSKLLERLGFTRDGVLRRNNMINNKLTDTAHYTILKEEFIASK